MDDISDPNYVREVGILADAMTKRYAHHPAVIAVGYDNEIGNGFMSYSEADRQRFIAWLKKKYGTIEELNKAWATQRWSRRLNSFEDVDLPLADGPGPSERYLDLHRYWSDVTVARLRGTGSDSPPQYAGYSIDLEPLGYSGEAGLRLSQHVQVLCLLWS